VSKRYVLLDRDGTVMVHVPYLHKPEEVELAPGAGAGLRALQQAGLGLVLVTNQSGVGRGMFPLQAVHDVHERLAELLAAEEVRLDGVYLCPHAPWEACECRKPAPGMARRAALELGFELEQSFMVGDSACDYELGRAIGATTYRIGPDGVADLAQACQLILTRL